MLFWLAVWQIISLVTPEILFASPFRTVTALGRLGVQSNFWLSIAHTLGKTVFGFALAFVVGSLLAVVCHRSILLRALLEPAVQLMKSVPVACFVVVALIWMSSSWISVLVSLFVVFPVTYVSLEDGLSRLDVGLEEMAEVFRVPLGKRVRLLYVPQLLPGVLAGCRVSIGMCWKASIAGELIGLPMHSIGEQLYLSKFYMSVDELFAWTAVIIVISVLFEKAFARLLIGFQRRMGGSCGDTV